MAPDLTSWTGEVNEKGEQAWVPSEEDLYTMDEHPFKFTDATVTFPDFPVQGENKVPAQDPYPTTPFDESDSMPIERVLIISVGDPDYFPVIETGNLREATERWEELLPSYIKVLAVPYYEQLVAII